MAEYIEREKLIKRIRLLPRLAPYNSVFYSSVQKAILDAPTADVVEVVRCKDCGMSRETEDERYLFCMQFADTVGFRAFCSYGARKEGAEE